MLLKYKHSFTFTNTQHIFKVSNPARSIKEGYLIGDHKHFPIIVLLLYHSTSYKFNHKHLENLKIKLLANYFSVITTG